MLFMKTTAPYRFDPTQFGYSPIADFPEIQREYEISEYFSSKSTLFLKVIAIYLDGKERVVLWYSLCQPYALSAPADNERVCFYDCSYDTHAQRADENGTPGRGVYEGTISTESFARELIQHLLSTDRNEDVATDGLERLNRDRNAEARADLDRAKAAKI